MEFQLKLKLFYTTDCWWLACHEIESMNHTFGNFFGTSQEILACLNNPKAKIC